jgi:hypothetical protein
MEKLKPCQCKQPLDLIGKTCFECGGPATEWRMYKSPILPWCLSCQWRVFEQIRRNNPQVEPAQGGQG